MSRLKFPLLLLFFFMFLLNFVTPQEKYVYTYDPESFRKQVELLDGNFIMFYAPWCKYCEKLHITWHQLAETINFGDTNVAIAQIDCTKHHELCMQNAIIGYPTMLYFQKNDFDAPVEFRGLHDIDHLYLFLSEQFHTKFGRKDETDPSRVKSHMGLVYLNDYNIEKFVTKGQHFIFFYMPWCKESQKRSSYWSLLARYYAVNEYIQIGQVNCEENEMTCRMFDIKQYPSMLWISDGRISGQSFAEDGKQMSDYVQQMMNKDNHNPEQFARKRPDEPVTKLTESNFDLIEEDLVFVNYFAPWCAHCMTLSPLWTQLGETFLNESRVVIAEVDCVASKPLCQQENIDTLPTLIMYKNKQVVSVEHGSRPLKSMVLFVKQHLSGGGQKVLLPNSDEEEGSVRDEL